MGSKKCFERVLTMAEVDGVRLWVGSASGPQATANVEVKEALFWNNLLVPDADFLGLMKNCGEFFGAYEDPIETNDVNILWTVSQSNGVYADSDGMSSLLPLSSRCLAPTQPFTVSPDRRQRTASLRGEAAQSRRRRPTMKTAPARTIG